MEGKDSYEVIVVDNASADNSVPAVKSSFPQVIVIERKINNGIAGWNDGFAHAQGEYFIVLDDDSNIESGLDEAIQYLDARPEVGILALNIKGGVFETFDRVHEQDLIGFIGCGAIIRKDLYRKIGGFAEWLFIYTHEWDYGIRCLDAGYKIKYFADCRVSHRTSSINRTSKRLLVYSIRNEMAIVYKFFNKDKRKLYLRRVFLNNLRGIYTTGFKSIPWYFEALKEFSKLKKNLKHTPVKKEVEEIYSKQFWATRPVYKLVTEFVGRRLKGSPRPRFNYSNS